MSKVTSKQLMETRMRLASNIAHCRNMIRCGYHTEFFQKLLERKQIAQKNVLREERGKRETRP